MRSQALAIVFVMAAGVAMCMAICRFQLRSANGRHYYERQRFADVFASLKRALERLASRMAEFRCGGGGYQGRVGVMDVPGMVNRHRASACRYRVMAHPG
jgi:putative ABC transport system permease protein